MPATASVSGSVTARVIHAGLVAGVLLFAVIAWRVAEGTPFSPETLPALFGAVAYLLTRDFWTLLATFVGLFLFLQFRPGRLAERV